MSRRSPEGFRRFFYRGEDVSVPVPVAVGEKGIEDFRLRMPKKFIGGVGSPYPTLQTIKLSNCRVGSPDSTSVSSSVLPERVDLGLIRL